MTSSDEDEDSEEESSDESDLSDTEDESDSEAGGLDLDVCPPGCDQNIYDNTCQLREKRCAANFMRYAEALVICDSGKM